MKGTDFARLRRERLAIAALCALQKGTQQTLLNLVHPWLAVNVDHTLKMMVPTDSFPAVAVSVL